MAAFLRLRCLHFVGQLKPSGFLHTDALLLPSWHGQNSVLQDSKRETSFFTKLKAEQLWKGLTTVSNAGRRRGRGRTVRRIKNLNKGQVIGIGNSNMVWPGLNEPVIRGKEIVERRQLPPDPEREAKLYKLRDEMSTTRRSERLHPLERGWSGAKLPGRSVGPPDPVGEDNFEGFDTRVLELKSVFNMTATYGRKRNISAFIVAGNKNGLAGFGLGKSIESKAAVRKAKNKAGQKLIFIERFDDHTILHDFYTRFGQTKLIVKKKPEGFGLICHRVLRGICEMLGIKNIHAKVEGAMNTQNMTKAFFMGLLKQRTHQQLANEKELYLVEFREENGNLPRVVAKPEHRIRTEEEIPKGEILDWDEIVMEGKVPLQKPKYDPYYMKLNGWQKHLKETVRFRNHYDYKVKIQAEHDALTSFILTREADKQSETKSE